MHKSKDFRLLAPYLSGLGRAYLLRLWTLCLLLPAMGMTQPLFAFSDAEVTMMIDSLGSSTPWSAKELEKILKDPAVKKLPDTFKLNVTEPLRLTDERYKHFTEAYAIGLAKEFNRRWRTTLGQASAKYGVDREVIVAVLLVETSFGRFTGPYHLLSVFSSTYVESRNLLASTRYQQLDERMQARVKARAEWSLNELRSLLTMGQRHPVIKPFELKGSYAGAFGKSQFLPSSYLNYAVKAQGEGSPNLFFEPDAIHSIANYLKGHGYKPGLDRPENHEAIFAYNNSRVYVNTILGVARALISTGQNNG